MNGRIILLDLIFISQSAYYTMYYIISQNSNLYIISPPLYIIFQLVYIIFQTISMVFWMKCWTFNIRWDDVFCYLSLGGLIPTTTKAKRHVKLGYKLINTSHFLFTEEPIILTTQSHQVFYLEDPKNGTNFKVVQVV